MFGATPQSERVDPALMQHFFFLYNTDPIMRAARSVILQHLSRDKMRFTRGDKPVKISRTLQLVIDTHWQRFIEDAVDAALVTGVVTWYVKKHDTQPGIPVVASQGTYTLDLSVDELHVDVRANPSMPDVKTKLHVYNGFGWSPTAGGMLTSPIMTVAPLIRVQRQLVRGRKHLQLLWA